MAKYRQKPIVIEAFHWQRATPALVFAQSLPCLPSVVFPLGEAVLGVETLEGIILARPGDWLIRGVAGEFYPCRADIFAATYEPVDDGAGGAE